MLDTRDTIVKDLKILKTDIEVPTDITKIIETEHIHENSNNKKGTPSDININNMPDDNNSNTTAHSSSMNTGRATMTAIEFYKICTQQLNTTYTGDPLGLPPLIDAIELLQFMDEQKAYENIILRVLKTKLMGVAREYLPRNATLDEIKKILKEKIKVKNSKVIMGQLMALKADRTNFAEYSKRAEDLAEQFNRALILEKVPSDTANEWTIDKTKDLCINNTKSQIVKSVLESTRFNDPKEVVATYIVQERKYNPTETKNP